MYHKVTHINRNMCLISCPQGYQHPHTTASGLARQINGANSNGLLEFVVDRPGDVFDGTPLKYVLSKLKNTLNEEDATAIIMAYESEDESSDQIQDGQLNDRFRRSLDDLVRNTLLQALQEELERRRQRYMLQNARRIAPKPASSMVVSKKRARGSEEDSCSVCLETFNGNQQTVITPCRHSFHQRCLALWVQSGHPTCPLCRAEL